MGVEGFNDSVSNAGRALAIDPLVAIANGTLAPDRRFAERAGLATLPLEPAGSHTARRESSYLTRSL